MDLWVIAATAATGYIAKYLQNISKGKENFPESSSEDFSNVKAESPRRLLSRLVRGKEPSKDGFRVRRTMTDGKNPKIWGHENTYGMEVPSTSGESSENNNDTNSHSLFSSMPKFPGNGREDWPTVDVPVGEMQMHSSQDSFRNRTFLRRKCRYRRLIKPLSSLESCLMAQFHDEQMTMEEYMLSPFPSPCTSITRPLLVTDGTRVISGNVGDSFGWQIQNEDKSAHVCGIPPLPGLNSSVASNKMRSIIGKSVSRTRVHVHGGNVLGAFKMEDLLMSEKEKTLHAMPFGLSGSYDAAVLLCLGISIGIMSSISSKNEVDKLKQALKQTENLVQDLQDELEMKDSLTVKELENENMEAPKNTDLHYVDDDKRECDRKIGENSASMSKIEAELEAELERLELNINTSNVEIKLLDAIELEPDFVADFAQGELRVDRIKGQPFDRTESNQDPSGKSTPDSGNYAVSPHELSLRLHEVIKSRLEERIKELERALQESQRKVELLMESELRKNPWTKLWESREVMRYERHPEIPVGREETDNNPVEMQPLVMNLAGEALDAYNEAYEELMKINDDSEEDDSPSETRENRRREEEESFMNKSRPWSYNNYMNDASRTAVPELLDVVGLSEEEENSEFEDEMEKQLIKQIVDKTKQGSPVVLNAQKILFLMEDREQNL